MLAFQERVVTEKAELDEKIEKLRAFSATDAFENLPGDEKARLGRQEIYMTLYSETLGDRIAHFVPTTGGAP